jgi:two-component system phosphate regulon sensor histidine kinase PhoR
MKRKFLLLLCTIFAIASICLVSIQLLQTQRSVAISGSLFSISVGNAMDDVINQLNRLKVEDYINQKDRYKLLKYKRVEELNTQMKELVEKNSSLFYDTTRVSFGTALKDSALVTQNKHVSEDERATLEHYNLLLYNRNKIAHDEGFYDRFVNDISEYVFDNILASSSFNYPMLDSLIYEQLVLGGIDIRPNVGVLNNTADTFLYISPKASEAKLRATPYRYTLHPDGNMRANEYFILLQFPSSALVLKEHSNIYLILSFVLIAIIILSFIITARMIFNQRKIDQMKNDFINNMTHEIKTPIATVSLACEMLRDKSISPDPASRDTYLGIIQNENHRMQMLVETILQSSKMGNKNFSLTPVEIDLNSIIDSVVHSFKVQVDSRGGSITQDFQAQPGTLYADNLHITNMIYNLIDNAVKYSPQHPDIRISTRKEGDNIILTVQDHGLGIDKENQKHIFDKFYRVNTGNVHDVKGFGLGLNYVKQVVDLHKGTIKVDSKLGEGTTFTITLPI